MPNATGTGSNRARGIVPLRIRVAGLVLLCCIGVGCPCVRGAVNANEGLRWWLFSNFGAQRMCPEIVKRGAPLKLSPEGNTVGRFFPSRCSHQVNDAAQSVTLHFGGSGFAWTPLAGRVGFSCDASIEYGIDWKWTEEAVYVWAVHRRTVSGPDFKLGAIENKAADWAARSPAGFLANTFGSQIVQGQLASGFTVVHTDEGDEFTLGHLSPPARPKRPFSATNDDRFVFASETTEIRYDQVDFLGPFEVADDEQALYFRLRLQGAAVDLLLLHRGTGDLWREGLQLGAPLAPPPQPPIQSWVLQPGAEQQKAVPLAKGQYYLVVDNSARAGTTSPAWSPLAALGGASAILAYSAELGDAEQ
jgi:hypothetical protein